MNFISEAKLTYLNACINEALRIYPPTPWAPALMTPPGGTTIDGVFVPGNVSHHMNGLVDVLPCSFFVDISRSPSLRNFPLSS